MTARKYGPICSYPGCSRAHNSHGLCNQHDVMRRKGIPLRPLLDRSGPIAKTDIDRFASKIALQDDGCIVWIGGKTLGGYGTFAVVTQHRSQTSALAHRWSYEYHVGPIRAGLDIDHLCRNRACINPSHLEPVTRQENVRRAAAVKLTCPAGHPYDDANTYVRPGTVHRSCRTCMHDRDLDRAETRNTKRRAERRARGLKRSGPALKTHCKRGHALLGDNLYLAPKSGIRSCRECRRINATKEKEAA